jgi:hypothetical protein
MKLTIIPSDKAVYEDGLCYSDLVWEGTPLDVHALQWKDGAGWIEFNDGAPNENITVLPDWANNAMAAWQVAYDEAHKPAPDPIPPTAEQNKQTASDLLYQTDWTTIPDVSDPTKSNPYLINVDEFLIYRNQIRQIAINPVGGEINWPAMPTAVWSKA